MLLKAGSDPGAVNRYDCQKCGKIWFSAANEKNLRNGYCTCGGKLVMERVVKSAEKAKAEAGGKERT